MNLELHQIGHFQFENLIQNRIPFLLLHFGQDLKEIFRPHHLALAQATRVDVREKIKASSTLRRLFLRQNFEGSSVAALISELEGQGYSKDHAVVILCEKGDSSESLVKAFLESGFQNCFYVIGGFEQLKREVSANS